MQVRTPALTYYKRSHATSTLSTAKMQVTVNSDRACSILKHVNMMRLPGRVNANKPMQAKAKSGASTRQREQTQVCATMNTEQTRINVE